MENGILIASMVVPAISETMSLSSFINLFIKWCKNIKALIYIIDVLVAVTGIEPVTLATETNVLPLHYTAYFYL